ncbi:MAG: hypothetical protein R3B91_17335 [Planctomycetaceae bacterium]
MADNRCRVHGFAPRYTRPTTYAYNADQLRVSREDSVETRKYVYDGTNMLLETAMR